MDWSLIIDIGSLSTAVVSLCFVYFIQTRRKSLSYAFSDTPIFNIRKRISGVEVTYLKKPVANLRLVVVRIRNSGNVPITEEDYKTPISFCLSATARGNHLAVGEIVYTPEASKPQLFVADGCQSNRLALKPMLLNPNDSIIIKIVIADYGGENVPIDVSGRIVGISEFKKERDFDNRHPIIKALFMPPAGMLPSQL